MPENHYWLDKWAVQDIGFHHKEINQHLTRFFPELQLPQGARVLVPLCGKSNDMLWLMQQGYHVVGTELAEPAVQAFFTENTIDYECESIGEINCYEAPRVTIYQGDMFEMPTSMVAPCDGYYDRAALVALSEAQRPAYAKQIRSWLAAHARGLLIAYTYEHPDTIGPPFSVPQDAVKTLYNDANMTCCYDGPLLHESKLTHYPLISLSEQVYQLAW